MVGVRASCQQKIGLHSVDLAVGEQQPDHPINLLSARRRAFGKMGSAADLGRSTSAALTGQGWKVDALTNGSCGGWQIANKLLQTSNLATCTGACGLALQPITMAWLLQAYKRLTLSSHRRVPVSGGRPG